MVSPGGPGADVYSVVVYDHHQVIRDAIRPLVDDDHRLVLVGETGGGTTCLDYVRTARPDILIMAMAARDGGPDFARAVKLTCPATQILVLSTANRRRRRLMLDAGADDWVPKSGRVQPLLDGLDRAVERIAPRRP